MLAAIAELKAHLSAYLRRVKAGSEVIITERGRPIARLVPIRPGDAVSDREQELAEKGILRPGRGVDASLLVAPQGDAPSGVLEVLLAERCEDR